MPGAGPEGGHAAGQAGAEAAQAPPGDTGQAGATGQADAGAQLRALAEAVAGVVGHGSRAVLAWLRLAQSEAALARAHLVRIGIAAAIGVLAVFFTWIAGAVALGAALVATGIPVALALALVFLAHVLVLLVLGLLMRRWPRALGFPRTRAAFLSMFRRDEQP